MLKVLIFFDFDGTIVDSAEAKLQSFLSIFSFLGKEDRKIVNQYLVDFQGIPREVKFKHIYQDILNKDIGTKDLINLSNKLDNLINKNIGTPKTLGDIDHFLDQFQSFAKFYIVSAAPHQEIISTLKKTGLDDYFEEIYGSEIPKAKAMLKVISTHASSSISFMVGDTINDLAAAKEANVSFIGFGSDPVLKRATPKVIDNYSDLPQLLGLSNIT